MTHFFFLSSAEGVSGAMWQPRADVYRVRGGWIIKFELAGVKPEDMQISVSGSNLTVQGIRRDLVKEEGFTYDLLEISYSRFKRSIPLPANLENANLSMEYKDGLLVVRLRMEEVIDHEQRK